MLSDVSSRKVTVRKITGKNKSEVTTSTAKSCKRAAEKVLSTEMGTWDRAFAVLAFYRSVHKATENVFDDGIEATENSILGFMTSALNESVGKEKKNFHISSSTIRSDVMAAQWAELRPSIVNQASVSRVKAIARRSGQMSLTQRRTALSMLANGHTMPEINRFIDQQIDRRPRYPDWVVPFSALSQSVSSMLEDNNSIISSYTALGQVHAMALKADSLDIVVYRGNKKVASVTAYNPNGPGPKTKNT